MLGHHDGKALGSRKISELSGFTAAIAALEKGGEWQGALQLFEYMLEAPATYQAVPRNPDQLETKVVFISSTSAAYPCEASAEPSAVTYNAIISACEGGPWQHALRLFERQGLQTIL